MPRKASKKDSTSDSKSDEVTPRRSGRSVTKQESTTGKEASRSRRSSTAAQTAASVADSRSSKTRSSTHRDNTPPSDSRTRGNREGGESPATRVKSTRRSTSRINYKESDGEEEAPTPKYDENFESGDEYDSESDEKSKNSSKNRSARKTSKGRSSKEKPASNTRGRRGRPTKKRGEETKTVVISDDSMEPEILETKTNVREKSTPKRTRGKKQKSEVIDVETESEVKPSRRSARAASNKEESPQKRPSRSVKAKRYTEEEEEDIEEISDSKMEEDETEDKNENTRKRKREMSPEESNKRIKDDDEEKIIETTKKEENSTLENKSLDHGKLEEPMEIDEADSGVVSQEDSQIPEKQLQTEISEEVKGTEMEKVEKNNDELEEQKESISEPNKKVDNLNKQSMETLKIENDTIVSNSEPSDKEQSTPSESKINLEIKESIEENNQPKLSVEENETKNADDSMLNCQPEALSTNLKQQQSNDSPSEPNLETEEIIPKDNVEIKNNETSTNVSNNSTNNDPLPMTPIVSDIQTETSLPGTNTCHTDLTSNQTLNGEKLCNSINPTSNFSIANTEHSENPVIKANGAHEDMHLDELKGSNCLLAGRKYIFNSKLNEEDLQLLKKESFGFLSYNLGSDMYVQKDKLLKEIHDLDSQIVCLQQVPKQFYLSVLEPSLDALGYKSIFSQPGDSLKGLATFYKSSQFRLNSQSEISLKELIDKELETSSLEPSSKAAVKSYIKRCGNGLLTHLSSVTGTRSLVLVNVQIPPSDLSTHALQMSCLAREIIKISGGANKPLLLGGEFNFSDSDASYQLLKDGYLANDMIDELQRRKDISVPEKENSSLVDLLWKSFQHPSSNLCSCYTSVLGHELFIPEFKKASPDLLWYSSDSLQTIGVVDVTPDKSADQHVSLKADIAFTV